MNSLPIPGESQRMQVRAFGNAFYADVQNLDDNWQIMNDVTVFTEGSRHPEVYATCISNVEGIRSLVQALNIQGVTEGDNGEALVIENSEGFRFRGEFPWWTEEADGVIQSFIPPCLDLPAVNVNRAIAEQRVVLRPVNQTTLQLIEITTAS